MRIPKLIDILILVLTKKLFYAVTNIVK